MVVQDCTRENCQIMLFIASSDNAPFCTADGVHATRNADVCSITDYLESQR